ncbi:MAG: SGNH/GDSL hydrolase family protein [Verrucomicrobia bacterium]|nr:SGNH/GDSL hydrolase family protein [Verrucomicrobiota bacterium]
MDLSQSAKKKWFGALLGLFICGSLAGLLLGGELYCRKLYGSLEEGPEGPKDKGFFFVFSPDLGWKGAPNVSRRHGSGVWVTHNEHGFRDTPWDLDTTKRRVLLLGDSNLWGYGAGDDEYPAALLNRAVPSVRWFNAGMNGYGTDQAYLLFQQLKPLVRPDLTVLVFCDNDRSENTSQRVRNYNKPYFALRNGQLELCNSPVPAPVTGDSLWAPAPDRVFKRTGSYLLYHVMRVVEAHKSKQEAATRKAPESSVEDPTEALIKALYEEAERRFLLVLISHDAALTEFCRREKIPFLDMGDTPARQPGPNAYPGGPPKHGHWTPKGNRVAAELIGRAVLALEQRDRL